MNTAAWPGASADLPLGSLVVPLLFALLLAIESRWPARAYPRVPGWRRRGLLFFGLSAVVGTALPMLLPLAPWQAHALLDLGGLPPVMSVPIGVLVTTFFGYWLHRAEHRFGWLWRLSHQLHHSAPRVDMAGAFYAHPVEVALKVGLGTLVAHALLGLDAAAASSVGLFTATASLLAHWNVHTPRWLGWWLQRPESHALHHEYGVHARNYSDLPLWDLIFGTFANPPHFNGRVGFDPERAARLHDMLLMRDVHQGR